MWAPTDATTSGAPAAWRRSRSAAAVCPAGGEVVLCVMAPPRTGKAARARVQPSDLVAAVACMFIQMFTCTLCCNRLPAGQRAQARPQSKSLTRRCFLRGTNAPIPPGVAVSLSSMLAAVATVFSISLRDVFRQTSPLHTIATPPHTSLTRASSFSTSAGPRPCGAASTDTSRGGTTAARLNERAFLYTLAL